MRAIRTTEWEESAAQIFWGEIAPCDHVVQIYENDKVFLDSLENFVGSGLIAGDSVIIIATAQHLLALNNRLCAQGFHLGNLSLGDRYIPLDAQETLNQFMVNDWPDEKLFIDYITKLITRAQKNGGKIRAFGEMVALLWQQGLNGATVQLETLWNKLQGNDEFTLFCAYPKSGFTQDIQHSIETICSAHSKVIDGKPGPSTEVYYRAVS